MPLAESRFWAETLRKNFQRTMGGTSSDSRGKSIQTITQSFCRSEVRFSDKRSLCRIGNIILRILVRLGYACMFAYRLCRRRSSVLHITAFFFFFGRPNISIREKTFNIHHRQCGDVCECGRDWGYRSLTTSVFGVNSATVFSLFCFSVCIKEINKWG